MVVVEGCLDCVVDLFCVDCEWYVEIVCECL